MKPLMNGNSNLLSRRNYHLPFGGILIEIDENCGQGYLKCPQLNDLPSISIDFSTLDLLAKTSK